MAAPLILHLRHSATEISAATAAVTRWLAEQAVPPTGNYFAGLTIEELVTNWIKYGAPDAADPHMEIELNYAAGELTIRVTDDGQRFNPLERPEPDVNLPVAERPIGGLGIHLLRKMADRIEYAWANGHNQLTLHKKLGGDQDGAH